MFDHVKRLLDDICRAMIRLWGDGAAVNQRPSFRRAKPGLEWLEKRIVPTSTWTGAIDTNWGNVGNWSYNGGRATKVPGSTGATGDMNDVLITGTDGSNPSVFATNSDGTPGIPQEKWTQG